MTAKEKKFCEFYVITNNATASAIKAGYSIQTANSIASKIKKKPHIVEYLKFLEAEKLAELGINKFCYMKEFNNIAKFNIKNYVTTKAYQSYLSNSEENTEIKEEAIFRIIPPSDLSDEHASCIKSIKYDVKGNFIGYEFWDKAKALSDMIKLFNDIEITNENENLDKQDIEAIENIIKTLNDLNQE